ncbi:MAG: threonylcarbamoyl-AMP synthase [Ignavibacteriae bacterium HGW-Ignavibacteriae-1]|jgi:L-threonylcarbamoyladenylate synthase|nr:MAG: threonylcarbamoyl-AMP synthase [Ignavibacteriae bacterium HGW-Ignavibacteriae-1]
MYIETAILDGLNDFEKSLESCSETILAGHPIVFPTETVYGLGASIYDLAAIDKIFEIKGREKSNPLAAHVCSIDQVEMLCEDIPILFYKLAETFLPGPLAIIMKRSDAVNPVVSSGLPTLSIRYPSNELCLELIRMVGSPLAATSANLSGEKSATNANQAYTSLNGRTKIILDGGETQYRMESTIISIVDEPKILRVGAISPDEIKRVLAM